MKRIALIVSIFVPLASCSDAKSVEYYMAHDDERNSVALLCISEQLRSTECINAVQAETVVSQTRDAERKKREEEGASAIVDIIRNGTGKK